MANDLDLYSISMATSLNVMQHERGAGTEKLSFSFNHITKIHRVQLK